eukprot:240597_1
MERDILGQLIRFRHNVSKLNDDQFTALCSKLMHQLKRTEIESILFSGLNAMRTTSTRASLHAKDILKKASNITFKISTKHKLKLSQTNSKHNNIIAITTTPTITTIPQFLIRYLCDYFDIVSLLKLQLINRYFCLISRYHRNYALLLIISPYNPINTDYDYDTISNDEHNDTSNYLHSVNENALNSGYYKKFFIPIKKLGAGSYGQVFLVNHIMHGIFLGKFAMKIVCVGDDLNRLIDILREVRTLQQLHHRNVIDYKHSWLENYQPASNGPNIPCLFILMEYADMGSVYDYIINPIQIKRHKNNKWLEEHEIWTIMFETCMGLQHLHQHGIVHRDIKPGNLLMTSLHTRHRIDFEDLELYDTNYRIVISDLGQADFVNSKESVSDTGNTGAYGFAAPELIFHDMDNKYNNEWDENVDIWSIGQLLYFLSFSCMPYQNEMDINNGNIEDIDIKLFYKDIINGTRKLYFPTNNGRSVVILNMIKKLCQIDPHKRPSLDSVISAIANILRSHQYISISYGNTDGNHRLALTAPDRCNTNMNGDNVSQYPVVKYIPRFSSFPALLPSNFQNGF